VDYARRIGTRLCLAACTALAALLGAATADGRGQAQPPRVGLVLEQPLVSRTSDPFQYGAYLGLQRAVRVLGVKGKVVSPAPTGSFVPPYSYLVRQGYDLTIGVGFLQADTVARVARLFPKSRFAILDARFEDLRGRPRNVEGTDFKTQEPAYLAGYLAAKMESKRPPPHVVSTVAGGPIPTVTAFIAGFQAGAKRADPMVTTLNAYTYDFLNESKCRRAAGAQLAQGSGVIFDVAGTCGVGALKAAKRAGAYGIGVDIDQSNLGPFILTSVVKKLDVAVYDFAAALRRGTFRTGGNAVFDLRNGAVGLGRYSPQVPVALRRELARLSAEIAAGKIKVPSTLTKRG
jgi:basic membrane protein A